MVRIARIAHYFLNSRSNSPLGGRFLRSTSVQKMRSSSTNGAIFPFNSLISCDTFRDVDLELLVGIMQVNTIWAPIAFNTEIRGIIDNLINDNRTITCTHLVSSLYNAAAILTWHRSGLPKYCKSDLT